MKKLVIFLLIPFMSYADWGKTGHRVVGEIAERLLNDTARAAIEKLLDGESLATASTWADEMRSNPEWRPFDKWHYVNLPLDKEYPDVEHTQDNIVIIIDRAIAVLKSPSADKEMKTFYLKYLLHLVGDIHQPMHTGRYEDYGGSKIKLQFQGRKGSKTNTNLHVLWDSNTIDDFKMDYTNIATYLEKTEGRKEVNQLDVYAWTSESHEYAKDIYSNTKDGDYIGYDYIYQYFPVVKTRLYQAGTRLGNLLNEIFS